MHTYRERAGAVAHRIVICLTMSALLEEPEPLMPPAAPAFFSKTFQNFKLSSAAAKELANVERVFLFLFLE